MGWRLPGGRRTQPGLSRDGKGRLEATADTQPLAVMDGGNWDHVFLLTAGFWAEVASPSCPHAWDTSLVSYTSFVTRHAEVREEVGEPAAMLPVHATHQGCACDALASHYSFQTCSLCAETPKEQDCRSLGVGDLPGLQAGKILSLHLPQQDRLRSMCGVCGHCTGRP